MEILGCVCYNQKMNGVTGMKTVSEQKIIVITLVLHMLLMIAAKLFIYSYQDGFLALAMVLLFLYFVFLLWAYRGRSISKQVVLVYFIYVIIQAILSHGFGVFGNGYFGELNLGSGFGLLFYGVLIVASCVLLIVINIVKWIVAKG